MNKEFLKGTELSKAIDVLTSGKNAVFFNGSIADKAFIISLAGGDNGGGMAVSAAGGTARLKVYITSSVLDAEIMRDALMSLGERVETIMSPEGADAPASLINLMSGTVTALILHTDALAKAYPARAAFETAAVLFQTGQKVNLTITAQRLAAGGYNKVDFVSNKGEFAVRGDILDVFPVNAHAPVRADFFGNLIESVRTFNPDVYAMGSALDKVIVAPCNFGFTAANSAIFEYILQKSIIFFDNPKKIAAALQENKRLVLPSVDVPGGYTFASFTSIYSSTKLFEADYIYEIISSSHLNSAGTINTIISDLKHYSQNRYTVLLCLKNEGMMGDYLDIFRGNKLPVNICVALGSVQRGAINLLISGSALNIILPNEKVALLSLNKLNEKQKFVRASEAAELPSAGDFVVHSVHGIGRCEGIEKLRLTAAEKDYIVISYASGGKLYCPCENADFITKYNGGEVQPNLNVLGGADFERVKARVRESVKKLAYNLVEIYKVRHNSKGFKFAEDDDLQREFEADFPFVETESQLAAINDVKADMQSEKVMDRLICGDVGYGKTEVAFRAAFKAILSGKQVAFLAPTTILTTQHYNNAIKRMTKFGIKVGLLNRFRTKAQIAETLADLKAGRCNIVFGTHRLLSKDVEFFDLGLLVLDEEQRFGVNHKEKIKNMRANIDVLAMSATPIPRTLHLSMINVRDISIIDTPPEGRMAVLTYVSEYAPAIVQAAIKRELGRGGQVLIVHNRIDTIFQFAAEVKALVTEESVSFQEGQPCNDISIDVVHARMAPNILEDKIMKLYSGETQILIATTLIENGIDLPNANTLIVTDADRMGLSQLYQLKGRVGRSDKLAYAYFTYEGARGNSENGQKRLEAINQFTALGSGYKIAMRDLELRGAGTILGAEQSGHMEKVGYDIYVKLLSSAISELNGENVTDAVSRETVVDLAAPVTIPGSYISDTNQRIKIYKDFAGINSQEMLNEKLAAVTAAYGSLPQEVKNLSLAVFLKNLGAAVGVKKIAINNKETALYFYKDLFNMNLGLTNFISGFKVPCSLKFLDVPIISLNCKEASIDSRIALVLEFLQGASRIYS